MHIVRTWRDLKPSERGASAALGNFDGVHRGHRQVIADAATAARTLGAPLGVISFDPHPRRLVQPDAPQFRIMSPTQQARALAALGVDILYLLPFDVAMMNLTAETFAREVLKDGLDLKHLAVGYDTTFGKGRSGDAQAMIGLGRELGFGVSVTQPVAATGGEPYSSTAVRRALQAGRPREAAAILGRPFAIEGVVQKGRQLGRQFGYPTANVPIGDYVLPRLGVYATRTRLPDGREVPGVANLGVNPTVGAVPEPRLEVWLFDFNEDLYGQDLETDLVEFLRPEETFASVEAMNRQVQADAVQARELLAPAL